MQQANDKFEKLKEAHQTNTEDIQKFYTRLDALMNAPTHRLNATMNKNVNFHVGQVQPPATFVTKKPLVKKKRTANRTANR